MSNIEKISSSYILKEIFSFLKIAQIIDIIIYNKKLHEDLGIGIEDYKKKVENIEQEKEMEKELNVFYLQIL